jgi:hypothetical protein
MANGGFSPDVDDLNGTQVNFEEGGDALMAGVALHLLTAAMSGDSTRLSVVVRLNLH